MRTEKGFSLVELLVVVAMILVIASIAVPSLLRAKMSAHESSAAYSSRSINSADATYFTFYEQGYSGTLMQLGPTSSSCTTVSSACADLLDSSLSAIALPFAGSSKSAYVFTYLAPHAAPTPSAPNYSYSITATPISPNSSGRSTFCMDQGHVLIKDVTGVSTAGTANGCVGFSGSSM